MSRECVISQAKATKGLLSNWMRGREDCSCWARRTHGEERLAVVEKVDLEEEGRKHLHNRPVGRARLSGGSPTRDLPYSTCYGNSQYLTRVRLDARRGSYGFGRSSCRPGA